MTPSLAQNEQVNGHASREAEKTEFSTPIVPFASYREETSALFGFLMIKPHRWEESDENCRPNTITLSAYYTLKNQGGVGFAPKFYSKRQEYQVSPIVYFHRSPSSFWGVGNKAGTSGDEESFTATGGGLMLNTNKRLFSDLRAGPSFTFGRTMISDRETGGLLETRAVSGFEGGSNIGVGAEVLWDGRDNIYWPSSGGFYTAELEWFRRFFGSDYNYEKLYFNFRKYLPITSKQVLALHAWSEAVRGDAPFYLLPKIGGISVLRGLFEGRYRDKAAVAVQAEYRVMPWRRWGAAVFAGVGEVASDWYELDASNLKWTGGGGLRIALDPREKINLRIDVGVSKLGLAPMVMIKEAF